MVMSGKTFSKLATITTIARTMGATMIMDTTAEEQTTAEDTMVHKKLLDFYEEKYKTADGAKRNTEYVTQIFFKDDKCQTPLSANMIDGIPQNGTPIPLEKCLTRDEVVRDPILSFAFRKWDAFGKFVVKELEHRGTTKKVIQLIGSQDDKCSTPYTKDRKRDDVFQEHLVNYCTWIPPGWHTTRDSYNNRISPGGSYMYLARGVSWPNFSNRYTGIINIGAMNIGFPIHGLFGEPKDGLGFNHDGASESKDDKDDGEPDSDSKDDHTIEKKLLDFYQQKHNGVKNMEYVTQILFKDDNCQNPRSPITAPLWGKITPNNNITEHGAPFGIPIPLQTCLTESEHPNNLLNIHGGSRLHVLVTENWHSFREGNFGKCVIKNHYDSNGRKKVRKETFQLFGYSNDTECSSDEKENIISEQPINECIRLPLRSEIHLAPEAAPGEMMARDSFPSEYGVRSMMFVANLRQLTCSNSTVDDTAPVDDHVTVPVDDTAGPVDVTAGPVDVEPESTPKSHDIPSLFDDRARGWLDDKGLTGLVEKGLGYLNQMPESDKEKMDIPDLSHAEDSLVDIHDHAREWVDETGLNVTSLVEKGLGYLNQIPESDREKVDIPDLSHVEDGLADIVPDHARGWADEKNLTSLVEKGLGYLNQIPEKNGAGDNLGNINATVDKSNADKSSGDSVHIGDINAEQEHDAKKEADAKKEDTPHANEEDAKKEDNAKKEEEKALLTKGEKVERFAGGDRFAGGGVMIYDPKKPLLARRKDIDQIHNASWKRSKILLVAAIVVILMVAGVVCYFRAVASEKSVFEGQSAGETVSEAVSSDSQKIGLSLSKRALPESVPKVCDSV